jgi:hypothetical protein
MGSSASPASCQFNPWIVAGTQTYPTRFVVLVVEELLGNTIAVDDSGVSMGVCGGKIALGSLVNQREPLDFGNDATTW